MPNYRNAPKEINPHYNREFELLMSGEKKIAVFSTGFFADSDWPDERYDLAVKQGKLRVKTSNSTSQDNENQTVYFFHPDKEELVDQLEQLFLKSSETLGLYKILFEEQIGKALGYSDEEIVHWIDFLKLEDTDDPLIGPHEGKELELMLAGTKPLAYFTDIIDPTCEDETLIDWADKEFAPYVCNGKIVREECVFTRTYDEIGEQTIHNVYFALPNEVWRIAEFNELVSTPYNPETFYTSEQRIGELLGYSKEAINHFIEKTYGKLVGG